MKSLFKTRKHSLYGWMGTANISFTEEGHVPAVGENVPHVLLTVQASNDRRTLMISATTVRLQQVSAVSDLVITNTTSSDYRESLPVCASPSRMSEKHIIDACDLASKLIMHQLIAGAWNYYRNAGVQVPDMYFDTEGMPVFIEAAEELDSKMAWVTTFFNEDPEENQIIRIQTIGEESTWVVDTEHGLAEVEEHDEGDDDDDDYGDDDYYC